MQIDTEEEEGGSIGVKVADNSSVVYVSADVGYG